MKYPEFWHRQRKLRLLELLNKVCDLGLVVLTGCLGGAYELLCLVWFWRGFRARGFSWRSGVVLHDSWWWGCDRLFFQARLYSLPSLNHRRGVVVAPVLGGDGIEFSVPATQLWARCLRSSSCTGDCCNYEAPNDSICVLILIFLSN